MKKVNKYCKIYQIIVWEGTQQDQGGILYHLRIKNNNKMVSSHCSTDIKYLNQKIIEYFKNENNYE